MIIHKSVTLKFDDIYDAVKSHLDEQGVCTPADVCSINIIKGETHTDMKVIVVLRDEPVE